MDGAKGEPGQDGVGVPSGGTTGQVLSKKTNADNDTEWTTPPDVSNFITNTVDNLVNYYTKSQTYTQSEVDALI